jgi:5-methylthioadenosine/S-adenosylhomocysteine deaminase
MKKTRNLTMTEDALAPLPACPASRHKRGIMARPTRYGPLPMSLAVDLLINARWVVPMDDADSVLEHHAVAVLDGRIHAVLPQRDARAIAARRVVDLPDHVLIPGLINAHTHAAMSLMRGLADDLPLMRWLQEAIWPAESRHVSEAFVRDGSLLAAAEMLRGGVTTCHDMYFFPDAAAQAFERAGMRAVLGVTVIEFPTPYASDADDYFRKGLEARDRWRGHPLIGFSIAPHAPYTVSDTSLERVASLAAELDCPIHTHIHETAHEIEESVARHGVRPLARLAALGLLGPNFLGVHAVHIDAADIELLARHGCSIAHCPTSNMKLASGIAPVAAMHGAGIRITLGTDGSASNNRLDVFGEMRQAALLAKVASGDATALPARSVLRMATRDAAEALGVGAQTGSIEAGKLADLCAVDLGAADMQPCYDPVSHLIYLAGRDQVSHVWVGGEARVENGMLQLQIDNTELIATARLWHTRLQS